jgi:hypothetical protein
MTMPEPGFKSITVPDHLYKLLKEEARRKKLSIAAYLEELLGLSTGSKKDTSRVGLGNPAPRPNLVGRG